MNSRGRLRLLGGALLALTARLWGHAEAAPAPVSAGQAPRAWVVYATRMSQQFQTALESDGEAARRFHASFEEHAAGDKGTDAGAADLPAVSIKAWVDGTGFVTRVECTDLLYDGAADDLRSVLVGQAIGAAPPRGMRQPVLVRLRLAAEL